MRICLVYILLLIGSVFARFSSFIDTDTIQPLTQNATNFAQRDIDYDGDIDWVAHNGRSPDRLRIIFNERYGKVTRLERQSPVYEINALDIGNADCDSVLDILVAGLSYEPAYKQVMSVVYGGTDRQFKDTTNIPVTGFIRAAKFIDMNDDSREDIVAISDSASRKCRLQWFKNTSSGWVSHIIIDSIGDQVSTTWIELTDFNKDNRLDFIIGVTMSLKSYINLYINNGDGSVLTRTVAYNYQSKCGAAADIDFDTDIDLYTGKNIFYNNGVSFILDTISDPPEYEADFVDVADVNGDGYPDLVASVYAAGIYIWQSITRGEYSRSLITSSGTKEVHIGDYDFDNFIDIAYIHQKNGLLCAAHNVGDRTFQPKLLFSTYQLKNFDIADLGNDNDIDFFITQKGPSPTTFSIFENKGDSTFDSLLAGWYNTPPLPAIKTADFNEDGLTDYIVDGSPSTVWYKQDSLGAFTINYLPTRIQSIRLLDYNKDGHIDITGSAEYSYPTEKQILCYLNNGEGVFTLDTLWKSTSVSSEFDYFYFRDFDARDTLSIRRANIGNESRYSIFDIDKDNKMDMLFYYQDSAKFGIIRNLGDTNNNGTSETQQYDVFKRTTGGGEIACADIDNDGLNDLIVQDKYNSELGWISQDTVFGFHSYHTITLDSSNGNVYVVDYDKDGWLDILTQRGYNIFLFRNLLGIPPAIPDTFSTKYNHNLTRVNHHNSLKPITLGNGCFKWILPTQILHPKMHFHTLNGQKLDLPVTILNNSCVIDTKHLHNAISGTITWTLYNDKGKLLGKGLLPLLR